MFEVSPCFCMKDSFKMGNSIKTISTLRIPLHWEFNLLLKKFWIWSRLERIISSEPAPFVCHIVAKNQLLDTCYHFNKRYLHHSQIYTRVVKWNWLSLCGIQISSLLLFFFSFLPDFLLCIHMYVYSLSKRR